MHPPITVVGLASFRRHGSGTTYKFFWNYVLTENRCSPTPSWAFHGHLSNLTAADVSGSFLEKSQRCRYAPTQLNWCSPTWHMSRFSGGPGSALCRSSFAATFDHKSQVFLNRCIGHLENKTQQTLNTQNFPEPRILRCTYTPTIMAWCILADARSHNAQCTL